MLHACNNGFGNGSSSYFSHPQPPNTLTVLIIELLQQLDLKFSHYPYLPLPLREASCLSCINISELNPNTVPCFTNFETLNCLCLINKITPLGIPYANEMPVPLETRNIEDHRN